MTALRRCTVAALLVALAPGCARRARTEPQHEPPPFRPTVTISADAARSAWVRITPVGMDAMAMLARRSIEGGEMPVAEMRSGDFTLCPGGGCGIALRVTRARVEAQNGGRLTLEAAVQARTRAMSVRYEQTWPCLLASRPMCALGIDTSRGQRPAIVAQAVVSLRVDRSGGAVVPVLDRIALAQGVESADVDIAGANTCGSVWCNLASAAGAAGMVAREVDRSVTETIRTEVEGTFAEGASRSIHWSSADGRGELVVAGMLADEVLVANGTLDAALRVGASTLRRHPCAPEAAPPERLEPLARSVLDGAGVGTGASGGVGAGGGAGAGSASVHVRLALGEAAIQRAFWAWHQAGAGCIDIDSTQQPALSPAALGALLPAAARLAPLGVTSPSIAVRMLEPPTARIRSDGSIEVRAARARIDLEAEVDGRRLRLASAVLDASAAVRIVPAAGGAGGLALSLDRGSFRVAVRQVWGAPAIGARRSELESTFGALVALARDAMAARTELAAGEGADAARMVELAGPVRAVGTGRGAAVVLDLRIVAR